MNNPIFQADQTDRAICAAICRSDGLKAKEIAKQLGLDHGTVNHALYRSPLMQELCWQDDEIEAELLDLSCSQTKGGKWNG